MGSAGRSLICFPFFISAFCFLLSVFRPSGFALASSDALDGLLRRAVSDVDIPLFAAEVDAAEAAEGADLEDVDVGRLLGLVRGDRGVAGGCAFHHVQRLARND